MNLLTSGEQTLFSKYWGRHDLANYDEFWEDIFKYYPQELHSAPLPLEYNPLSVRMVHDMLDCPPGKCGGCCFYKRVHLSAHDILRIIDSKSATEEELSKIIQNDEKGDKYMSCSPAGCYFLKDNVCSIYKSRPDICYIFPFGSSDCEMDGRKTSQMTVRIRCKPALDLTRDLITKALKKGDKLLLPNLMIIKK